MSERRKRRHCRRDGHPVSLAITAWDGSLVEVCYCARTLGMMRRLAAPEFSEAEVSSPWTYVALNPEWRSGTT